MKKQRLGVKLCFLCRKEDCSRLSGILFRETGALGVRFSTRERLTLTREERVITTAYGPVRVKIGHLPDGGTVCKAEFEDCRKLALQHGVPLRRIADEAERLFNRGK